jgi:4-diphosphocytidyl-2-C-methyl-D-erythritol kinase
MTGTARVVAQAKVNLVLRVLAREASGYHSIETVFLRLDLGDVVQVRATASGRSVDCAGPAMPVAGVGPAEKNLAYRAAVAYQEATGWPAGFAIEVDKRIPVGAGLGGGSADAGAVLRSLDALAPRPLGRHLLEIAAPLGSDVPFMTLESPMALGWSRGERLHPVRPLEPRPVAVLKPSFSVATAEAYAWMAADRGEYAPSGAAIHSDDLATWEAVSSIATNDFQAVVGSRHSVLLEMVDDLASRGALVSVLAGSGSAVFGVFSQAPDAAAIARGNDCDVLMTRTSDRVVRVEAVQ